MVGALQPQIILLHRLSKTTLWTRAPLLFYDLANNSYFSHLFNQPLTQMIIWKVRLRRGEVIITEMGKERVAKLGCDGTQWRG